jgi:hypothetical protein
MRARRLIQTRPNCSTKSSEWRHWMHGLSLPNPTPKPRGDCQCVEWHSPPQLRQLPSWRMVTADRALAERPNARKPPGSCACASGSQLRPLSTRNSKASLPAMGIYVNHGSKARKGGPWRFVYAVDRPVQIDVALA